MKLRLTYLLAFAAGVYLLIPALRKILTTKNTQPRITSKVAALLPIAHDLKTASDEAGNYDIDGVSFDVEGVIVGSDLNKDIYLPI